MILCFLARLRRGFWLERSASVQGAHDTDKGEQTIGAGFAVLCGRD
jgi:hypothetical protein